MNNIAKFYQVLLCLTLALMFTGAVAQVPPGISESETEQLADNLYTFRWGPYRSIFLVTSEGVIATDPISTVGAKKYREAIAAITPQPVKFLVYSHAHWDHASGGQIFKDEGAQIVAQERCVTNMKESPNPDVIPPDITFSDSYSVELGEHSLDLFYFGPSHGTCLVVMIPRPYPMLYSVDIATPHPGGRYMPWDPQVADFHFYNAVQYLTAVEQLAEREQLDTLIGAHLVPRPQGKGVFTGLATTGPISGIRERRIFWEDIMGAVKAEMDAGTPSFLVSGRLDLAPFENIDGFRKRQAKQLIDRIAAFYAIGK